MWASIIDDQVPHITADAALEDEHCRVIKLIDELHQQIVHVAPISEQRFALHMMGISFRVNCLAEQALMDESSFPLRREHEEEHRTLYVAVRSIEEHILALRREDAIVEVNALRRMAITHIREKDQEIVDWMHGYKAKGLRHSA